MHKTGLVTPSEDGKRLVEGDLMRVCASLIQGEVSLSVETKADIAWRITVVCFGSAAAVLDGYPVRPAQDRLGLGEVVYHMVGLDDGVDGDGDPPVDVLG